MVGSGSREERLAAALRDNLRRRKAQSRARADAAPVEAVTPRQGEADPPEEDGRAGDPEAREDD